MPPPVPWMICTSSSPLTSASERNLSTLSIASSPYIPKSLTETDALFFSTVTLASLLGGAVTLGRSPIRLICDRGTRIFIPSTRMAASSPRNEISSPLWLRYLIRSPTLSWTFSISAGLFFVFSLCLYASLRSRLPSVDSLAFRAFCARFVAALYRFSSVASAFRCSSRSFSSVVSRWCFFRSSSSILSSIPAIFRRISRSKVVDFSINSLRFSLSSP